MRPGDKVHIPAPEKSNANWTAYHTVTVVAVDNELVTVSLKSDPTAHRVVPRDDALTAQQFQAYLMSVRNGGA